MKIDSNEILFRFHDLETGRFLMIAPLSFFVKISGSRNEAVARVLHETKEGGTSEVYFNGRGNLPSLSITRVEKVSAI